MLVQDQLYLYNYHVLWALLSTASWKTRQKEQMDNSALDSFAASVGFPGRAKTCISDSIRTAGQHLKF